MRKSLIGLFILSAAACTTPVENAREIPGKFVYLKDHRTDLCFVYRQYGDSSQGMLSNVPCTEKVEALIVNGAEQGR